jgi:glycosyltransferase involved in cell wall biosynthesis
MPSAAGLRVLGVSLPDVSDWREPVPQGQWSQFYGHLAQHVELIDVIHPRLSQTERYLNYARTFHPIKSKWKARAGFNRSLAMTQTKAAQRGLSRYGGSYDLIMQLQTLCAPGFDRAGIPYAIYTDNTMALTQRIYPAWAPLSAGAAASWMRFEADVCQSAAAVLTYSEFARRSVIDDYGCSPDSVVAVGAGANQLLDSLGEKDYTVPRALFVGVDFTIKGGHILLEAWPIVREHVPDAELIIAGPAREPKMGLPAGVSWMGWVDRARLASLYKSASVFVLPSLFEAWGHVLLEAMGHGLPCIGTSCCAMSEIIDEGVTGRLVPRYESEPLADALIELFTYPDKAAAMGHAAHASVLREHRWTDVLDRVMAHLDTVSLSPQPKPGSSSDHSPQLTRNVGRESSEHREKDRHSEQRLESEQREA